MQCEVIHCLVLVLLAVLASYLGWSKTCVGLSLKVQLYLEEDLTQPYQCRPLTLSKFSMLAQLCVQAWHPLWQMFLFICGEEARILQRRVSAMSSGYLFTLVCKFIVVYEPGMRTGIPQQWEHHDSRGGGVWRGAGALLWFLGDHVAACLPRNIQRSHSRSRVFCLLTDRVMWSSPNVLLFFLFSSLRAGVIRFFFPPLFVCCIVVISLRHVDAILSIAADGLKKSW